MDPNSIRAFFTILKSIGLEGAFVILILAVAACIIFYYILIPLLKLISPTNLLRVAKMFLDEVLGRHGKVGVMNILTFLFLIVLCFTIFQGEAGIALKDFFVSQESSSPKPFPYCFFLSFLVTVCVLIYSMHLLFRLEEKKKIKQ